MNPIRDHFRPYQPTIEHGKDKTVIYEELQPDEELRDYLYCYWHLKTLKPLDKPFQYRVVSDGCIDILVELSKPRDFYITGFSTRYLEYELGTSFHYVGARFLPTGFPAMFGIAANQLTDSFQPLSEVAPTLHQTMVQTATETGNMTDIQTWFDTAFLRLIRNKKLAPEIDQRFVRAVHQILEARGNLNLNEIDVGVSERQLRRLFEYYFGQSPKTFCKIIRFQNILGAKPSATSLRENKIFYDEGYYDQAHFIKEFKAFYGVTPSKAFGR